MSKTWEHREGSFMLFNNDRKEKENQPDMKGEGMFEGVICELSAWRKQGRKGEFLSLKLQPKRRVEPGSLPYADRPERPETRTSGENFVSNPIDDPQDVPF